MTHNEPEASSRHAAEATGGSGIAAAVTLEETRERDALHEPSGRTALGVALALVTVSLWAMLPIGLKIALQGMDPLTITWYRFLAAAILLGTVLTARGSLPRVRFLRNDHWRLLAAATLGLAGNYALYVFGLARTNAGTAQVVIQIAPVLLGLGGIVAFRERFSRLQWIGLAVMVSGLVLFSREQIAHLLGALDRYYAGVGLLVLAGISWAIYGLAQKQLLSRLSSPSIMLCIYVGCSILFTPFADWTSVTRLAAPQLAALIFCIVNMLVAYGAFAESLAHIEASRASALLAIVPLATLALLALASRVLAGIVEPEPVTGVAVAGATLVVAGSVTTTFGQGRR